MGELTLDSLEVTGFRAFDHLTIEPLGRVNLIVGKNNVGKSCLLEALGIYARRGAPEIIQEILSGRDEGEIYYESLTGEERIIPDTFKHLFYGWRIFAEHPPRDTFTIGPLCNEEARLAINMVGYVYRPSANHESITPRQTTDEASWPGIRIALGNKEITTGPLESIFKRSVFQFWPQLVKETPCVFVSAKGLSGAIIGALWDAVTLKPVEQDVLHGLQIIDPKIERVNLIQVVYSHSRLPVVKVQNWTDPILLRSLGEGTNRLFGILLALVNAKNGLLLIDEIDSGLHYTIQPDLWRLIFEVSARLNVQVFATTHSWDCIEGFQRSAQDTEVESMLIRLERRQEHIVPVLFDKRRLGIATRQDIEVR